MNRLARWATLATVVAVAVYVVWFRLGPYDVPYLDRPGRLPPSRLRAYDLLFHVGRLVDTYVGFYPSMVYGLRSLRDGGRGMLWNPFLSCGQPFLGRFTSSQLYPPYLVSFALAGELALWAIVFFHLIVAGLSAYLLCRELRVSRTAALCGAVMFELSNATMETATWQPHTCGSFVWLPAAMLFCERTLRAPTARNVIGLAVTLALALLAGFPQIVFYTYLLIGLRVAWELATRRPCPATVVLAVGLGLALAPLVGGLELIPAAETTLASVRSGPLNPGDFDVGGFLDWRDFRVALAARAAVFQPLSLVPWMLGASALLAPATRRRGLFYACAGLTSFVLALGPTTPLLSWYLKLPFATAFRWPQRFMWLTSFCLAVVAALGADALLSHVGSRAKGGRIVTTAATVAALLAFRLLAPDGLRPLEWVLGGLVIAAFLGASIAPAVRGAAGVMVLGAVVLNLVAVPVDAWQSRLTSGASVLSYAPQFARLRARMTAQDRVYFNFDIPFISDFALTAKSASVYEVPSFFDYEPQVARRYAEFFTMLRTGAPLQNVRMLPHNVFGEMPRGFNRPLLNLAAGHYVLAEPIVDNLTAVMQPPLVLLEDTPDARLYENTQALPRARYVPRIEVVADSPALLRRLAFVADNPRQVAFVESPLPSGFTGVEGNTAPGTAEFLLNDPEHLVLRVEAPAPGFLVLADQYFPGWGATVNGAPRPIVRANYVFRLVEVPGGDSRVEFRYAPGSVRLGAWVSGVTLLGMTGALAAPWIRRRSRVSR